jgi:hypothetical protein
MAKTYTAAATATAGEVYTASAHNVIVTDVNNFIVPPMVQVRRTTDLTSYTSNTLISWTTTAAFDTDGMFSSGAPTYITVQTPGIYLVNFVGQITGSATISLVLATLYKNGVSNRWAMNTPQTQSTEAIFSVSGITECVAGDTLAAGVNITGGSNYTVKGSASESFNQSRMTAKWIGRTS